MTISEGNPVSITIELSAGGNTDNADWWVLVNTPFGWYYYNIDARWQRGMYVTYRGSLRDVPSREVLNTSILPDGSYKFYFGVDTNKNGSINMDKMYYNSVGVTIT